MNSPDQNLLEVKNVSKEYYRGTGLFASNKDTLKAVDSVSFGIAKGESLGLVGETGCGKTTVARMIVRIIKPSAGEILFRDEGKTCDLAALSEKELKQHRKNIQIIFQDPLSSLSPRKRVLDIIAEPLICQGVKRKDCIPRVEELLKNVGLDPRYIDRYPHSFSGGQRQRIGIARALSVSPELVVADEPVSALDVSVQAHILNLMLDLQKEFNLTYLFISHDLGVIRYMCVRIAVMYMGRIVELAGREELYSRPLHPYTSALLGAVPDADPSSKWESPKMGEGDRPRDAAGCAYCGRCPFAREICGAETPELKEKNGHFTACHLTESLSLPGVSKIQPRVT